MKKLALIVVTVLALSAVAFAGGKKETEVTRPAGVVTVTVGYNLNELSEAEVAAFEDKHPTTRINQVAADYNVLMSSIAAGNPPNLFRTETNQIPYFIVRDLLQPIDSYIAASTLIDMGDLETLVVDAFRYDKERFIPGEGPLYGLPKDYSLLFDFFYRKDIWEQAGVALPSSTRPMSYRDFRNAIERLTVRDGDRTIRWGYHGLLDGHVEESLDLLLAQMGQSMYADDRRSEISIVDNPDAVEILRFIYDLAKDRLTDSPIDPADAWLGGNLVAENPRSALYHFGYWAGAMYNDPETADLFGYAPSPLWGDKWLNGGHLSGTMMFKSNRSYMNDEAWKFMEYFHAELPALNRTQSGWGLPIQRSFYDMVPQATELDRMRLEVTTSQLDMGNYYITSGNPWALEPLRTVWHRYWADALSGAMSFEEFLSRVEREANDLIRDGLNTLGEF